MKQLTIMCGLPRSGKSTWVEKNKDNAVVVSADKLRYHVYGQRFWAGGEPLMWSIRGIMFDYLLMQGVDIIVDETNTTIEKRGKLIKLGKNFGYNVECVHMDTPWKICENRAIADNQEDLIPVITRMKEQFVEPSPSEGFNMVVHMAYGESTTINYNGDKEDKDNGKV
jgi:predicted kinase